MHRTYKHAPIVHENLPAVKRKTRRRIRGLLLLGTLAAIAIFGVTVYFWHAYQTDRNADSFMQRAKVLEEEQKWLEAAEYYRLYLQLRTHDVRAEVGLAKAYDKWAGDPASKAQAAEYYGRAATTLQRTRESGAHDADDQLVSVEGERTLRRRMVELLLEGGDFTAALEQFVPERLDKATDPQAARLYALTLYERFRYDPAAAKRAAERLDSKAGTVADELEEALRRNPGDIRLSVTLAKAYRDQPKLLSDQWRIKPGSERADRADAIMEEMLSGGTQTFGGLLAHYDYQVRYGLPPSADNLRKALQLDPESVVVRLKMAKQALREARRVENAGGLPEKVNEHRAHARRHYETIIREIGSLDDRAYLGLGRVNLIEGDAQRARQIWELGLEQGNKNSILLNSALAESLIASNELKDAARYLSHLDRAIIRLRPTLSRSRRQSLANSRDLIEARWLMKQGKHARAISLLNQVALVEPATVVDTTQRFQRLMLLGATYVSLQQWPQAATTYERAAQLGTKAVEPHLAAAHAWLAADQFTNAIVSFRKAVALAPESAHVTDARLRLAQIYEIRGEIANARQQYTPLLQCQTPKPKHLAMYIALLLRADLLDQASDWLDKLDVVVLESLGTVQLQTRLLRAQNRTPRIGPLVERFAKKSLARAGDDPGKKAAIYLAVGHMYSDVTLHKAAEAWYRRLAEATPRRLELLGMSLARQGRIKETIRLCTESARSEGPLRPAIILAAAVQTTEPTKEDLQVADTLLAEAMQQHDDHAGLLVAVAGVRVMQSRSNDAVELYEKALRIDPKHLAALNNLATLLSERVGERERALEYVDRAIKIGGRRPAMLDTKGMILLHQGHAAAALPLLQQAAWYYRTDPRFSFHLAVAYYRAGAFDKAHVALQRAYDHKLTTRLLTQADRILLAELEGTLQQQSYSRTLSDPNES